MKRYGRISAGTVWLSAVAILLGCSARAAAPNLAVSHDAAPSISAYIHQTWDVLQRSATACNDLIDPKVKEAPMLYLPAGVPEPADVATLHARCGIDVRRLPRVVTKLGDVRPEELPRAGLLYLPKPYVVPGGRFNEMYGWDSFFIAIGLLDDGRLEQAHGMAENFFYEIANYGALLNANRTYYLTRSQPPLLAEMIRRIHEADVAKSGPAESRTWLAQAYAAATADYGLWVSPLHRAGDTGLARYADLGEGPVPEMADDSTYYPDAIRWMLAHPAEGSAYLVPTKDGDAASCDRTHSEVCAHAEVNGMRLTRAFYRGDRAMRESGFDTSFRFGAFSGSTDQFAPVDLNALLYRYELDMAGFAGELSRSAEQRQWKARAAARRRAVDRYLWDATRHVYEDYNFVSGTRSTYLYASIFYPLWAGLASPQQASGVVAQLPKLEREHGLAMSNRTTGMQWDAPFGWAPTTWFAVNGLRATGFGADAARLSAKYRATVEANYLREGTIREKYNVETGDTTVQLVAGYKSNAAGFGWTNSVYLELENSHSR